MDGRSKLFREEMRRLRKAAGLSLAELARRVNYTKGYLSKIETGIKPVTADVARRCDTELDAGGALIALAARPVDQGPDLALVQDDGRDVWVMSLEPDASGWFTPLARRDVLATGGVALLGLSASGHGLHAAANQDAFVDAFGAVFARLRALGRTVSPSIVLPAVIAQASALRAMARASAEGIRERWLLLAARHAEYAGWLAQESGNPSAAVWWTDTAVTLAAGTADTDMAAHALVRRALIAMYRDDAAATIDLARRAQQSPASGLRVRGLAALREAQGHALAGDAPSSNRALDRGAEQLQYAPPPDPADLALGSTQLPDVVATTRGWCLHDLGRPGAAAAVLEEQLAHIPPDDARARARYGARLALAHATSGEVDRACQLTAEILRSAAVVDSDTIRTDLARLSRTLARWHSRHEVRDLQPQLIAALHRPSL